MKCAPLSSMCPKSSIYAESSSTSGLYRGIFKHFNKPHEGRIILEYYKDKPLSDQEFRLSTQGHDALAAVDQNLAGWPCSLLPSEDHERADASSLSDSDWPQVSTNAVPNTRERFKPKKR